MITPVHEYISVKQDFHDAQRLHRRNRRWVALGYYSWYVALPTLAGLGLLYVGYVWLRDGQHEALRALTPVGALVYLAVLLSVARWFQVRRLWNQFQPKKYCGKPVTLQFDEEQIIAARPGESESRFFWPAVEDYAEDERLALVYVHRKLFLFIPKRAMDEAEWARLRTVALPRKATK